MNREPPPVFRFNRLVHAEDGEPLCVFVIGYAAAPDQAWEAVAVNETFVKRWQLELEEARWALAADRGSKK